MAAGGGTVNRTYSFKVVLLGEGCVGKTSLVLRYCENKFNDKHITTLQVTLALSANARKLPVFPLRVTQHTSLLRSARASVQPPVRASVLLSALVR